MIDRWKTLLGALAMGSTPFLMGAEGKGCSPPPDAGDGAPSCVSTTGGPCGGNVRSPCTCALGLECRSAGGGLPVGDVGGTCQGGVDSDAAVAATDTGVCVALQGEHCGGNTTHPCSCAAGLSCTPTVGGPPFGDVGGSCEPPTVDSGPADAACVQRVLCIQGATFDRTLCRCVPQSDAGIACQSASDCHGILPQLCIACPGADAGRVVRCAHWVCRAGQCETAICN